MNEFEMEMLRVRLGYAMADIRSAMSSIEKAIACFKSEAPTSDMSGQEGRGSGGENPSPPFGSIGNAATDPAPGSPFAPGGDLFGYCAKVVKDAQSHGFGS